MSTPAKPKTYPAQIQELKAELQQVREQLQSYQLIDETLANKDADIQKLKDELALAQKAVADKKVSDKAQLTDAIQRAESAEIALQREQLNSKQFSAMIEQKNTEIENRVRHQMATADRIEELSAQVKAMASQVVAADRSNQRLIEDLGLKDNDLASVHQELRGFRQAHAALQQAFTQLDEDYAVLKTKYENDATNWRESFDRCKYDNVDLLRQLKNVQTTLRNIRNAVG